MTLRRRAIDWSLAGLLLLLPALILRSSLKTGELSGFDKAVLRVSSPLEGAVTWVVEGVGGGGGGVGSRCGAGVGGEGETRELRAERRAPQAARADRAPRLRRRGARAAGRSQEAVGGRAARGARDLGVDDAVLPRGAH